MIENPKNDSEIAYSALDLWGGVTHFNSRGEKVGYSMPDKTGVMVNHDASGHIIGYSAPDLFGGTTHFDAKGGETGYSYPDLMGGTSHRDKFGHETGFSYTDEATGISAGRFSGVDNPARYAPAPGRARSTDGKDSIGSSTSRMDGGSTVGGGVNGSTAAEDPTWRTKPESGGGMGSFFVLFTVVPVLTTIILLLVYGSIAWFFGVPLLIIAGGSAYLVYRVKKAEKYDQL